MEKLLFTTETPEEKWKNYVLSLKREKEDCMYKDDGNMSFILLAHSREWTLLYI